MKKIALIIVIVVLVIAGFSEVAFHWPISKNQNQNQNKSQSQGQEEISFPAGGETLAPGTAYTLLWNDPKEGSTTQIFLIDTSLEKIGASVSIADRVYGIPNTGSYHYSVPAHIPPGIYVFSIGTLTSKEFQISSSSVSSSSTANSTVSSPI